MIFDVKKKANKIFSLRADNFSPSALLNWKFLFYTLMIVMIFDVKKIASKVFSLRADNFSPSAHLNWKILFFHADNYFWPSQGETDLSNYL